MHADAGRGVASGGAHAPRRAARRAIRLEGRAALDALRHQRSGGAEPVPSLASRGARGAGDGRPPSTSTCGQCCPGTPSSRSSDGCSTKRPRGPAPRSSRCWRRGCRRRWPAPGWPSPVSTARSTMAHLTREDRRRLAHALLDTPLDVEDSRGYAYAEVTAGGVPLDEIDTAHDGVAPAAGPLSGGGDSRRGRPARRLQLPVGVVVGLGGRTGDRAARSRRSGMIARRPRIRRAGGVAGDASRAAAAAGRALDVACGRGRNAVWLARQGFATTAIDRDAAAVAALRRARAARTAAALARWPWTSKATPSRSARRRLRRDRRDALPAPAAVSAAPRGAAPGGDAGLRDLHCARKRRAAGRPIPTFLLEPGELRRLVAPLEILDAREGDFEGRMVAGVVAEAGLKTRNRAPWRSEDPQRRRPASSAARGPWPRHPP